MNETEAETRNETFDQFLSSAKSSDRKTFDQKSFDRHLCIQTGIGNN